ncbi:MAG: hypothetical protein ABW206_00610 [Agrobacterium vaccinii]|jgi:hypothetical protein
MREEACRQTLVILQHENILRETSEFRSHASLIADRFFVGNIVFWPEMAETGALFGKEQDDKIEPRDKITVSCVSTCAMPSSRRNNACVNGLGVFIVQRLHVIAAEGRIHLGI